jgi:hypothetical protein
LQDENIRLSTETDEFKQLVKKETDENIKLSAQNDEHKQLIKNQEKTVFFQIFNN